MYVSTADFRAPFDPVDFQGLGAVRARREYYTVANFRAPYDDGYFQNNTLFGVPSNLQVTSVAPPLVRRYLANGEPVPTTLRDVATPLNQINRWIYAGIGLVSLYAAHRAYKRWKKTKGPAKSSNG
jgi:hypothetical protein